MSDFASRLKEARTDAKLTQPELAKEVGLAQGTISDLERKRRTATTKVAEIALALKVNPNWLATGKGSKTLSLSAQEPTAAYRVQAEPRPEALQLFEQLSPKQQQSILEQMKEMVAENTSIIEAHQRRLGDHYQISAPLIKPGGGPERTTSTQKTHKRSA